MIVLDLPSLLILGLLLINCLVVGYWFGRMDGSRVGSDQQTSSPPASVTGPRGLPDRTAQSPPVAVGGGETG
ncbi:hypothetical protein [Pseudomonas sp. NCCP-436]|uniref:hypothetical protein n=1 Tax=Pseudomonas sp. NCCP-436 TaxID=2842481 RepID=UPI001C81BA2C|nr:hypothetical protein [Pseudomonas sp. NCCP-436]GIZ13882.1 hypothetical protein NCCP436_32980 [Pseudomonas sp. NCCP-436]GIZ13994.1 hypothetical protein NCCP436_34100 [Pseudomonas sp. NCCP-436]